MSGFLYYLCTVQQNILFLICGITVLYIFCAGTMFFAMHDIWEHKHYRWLVYGFISVLLLNVIAAFWPEMSVYQHFYGSAQ